MTDRIAYPDDPLQAAAWLSAIQAASAYQPIVTAYQEQAGHLLFPRPPRNGLERMVDEACGISAVDAEEFMQWFNRNVWGEDPFGKERCPGFPCALIAEAGREGDEKSCPECGRRWRWDADPENSGWELMEDAR